MTTRIVTGACGCIGAWVLRELVNRGEEVVALDLSGEQHRIEAVLSSDQIQKIRFINGDIVDPSTIRDAIESSGATSIIHLAGLQVPSCRADPVRGAMVNILGTLNVLQAAKETGCTRVVYASSAAVHGPPIDTSSHAFREDETLDARTHYGVFKHANEGAARVMWHDHGLASVGLRPLTVYGVGRDFGLTSGPTTALKSAMLGRPFVIGFKGPTDFQYVQDVAEIFVRSLDEVPDGAHVFNLHGVATDVENVVEVINDVLPEKHRGLVSCEGPTLPLPGELSDEALSTFMNQIPRTSLEDGYRKTFETFAAMQESGHLDTRDLPTEVPS